MTALVYLSLLALFGAFTRICYTDIRYRRINNKELLFVLFVVCVLLLSELNDISEHLASFALLFGLSLILFRFRVVAGGDTKLLMVIGALIPLARVGDALVLTALVGGALALVCIFKYRVLQILPPHGHLAIPYGVAIVIGFFPSILLNYLPR